MRSSSLYFPPQPLIDLFSSVLLAHALREEDKLSFPETLLLVVYYYDTECFVLDSHVEYTRHDIRTDRKPPWQTNLPGIEKDSPKMQGTEEV